MWFYQIIVGIGVLMSVSVCVVSDFRVRIRIHTS